MKKKIMKKINIEDLNRAELTRELAHDAVKHIIVGEKGRNSIDELMLDEEIRVKMKSRFANSDKAQEVSDRLNSVDKNLQVDNLLKAISKDQKRRESMKRRRLFVSTVACAAAVIAVSFFVWDTILNMRKSDIRYVVTDNIEVTKPTIILDGGEYIELEKLSREIVEANTTLKKTGEKKVSYISEDKETIKQTLLTAIAYNTVIVPAQNTYTLTLSDGSEVILNAGSSLKYPVVFSGNSRKVELKGEALFRVAKSDIPFIVNTDTLGVKVYGTLFNMNCRNLKAEVVLLSGSVGATVAGEETMMTPRECFTYNLETGVKSLCEVDVKEYISWIFEDFHYMNRDIDSALSDIVNWYGISISYTKSDFSDKKVNLYSPRSQELPDVLHMLELTLNAKIINEGGGQYLIVK